jgi:hypothetical protein
MDKEKAISYLMLLKSGINPVDGSLIDTQSFLNKLEMIEFFDFLLFMTKTDNKLKTTKKEIIPSTKWEKEEDLTLSIEWINNVPVDEITRLHNRSRNAIITRLVKIGRLKDKNSFVE